MHWRARSGVTRTTFISGLLGVVVAVSGASPLPALAANDGQHAEAAVRANGEASPSADGEASPSADGEASPSSGSDEVAPTDPSGSPSPGADPTATERGSTNEPPTAREITVSTPAGVPVEVLLDATDPDGDPLSYTTPAPAHGALSGTSPQLTYTPSDGFTGTDSFDYTVQDAEGAAATAVVTITVIDAGPSVDSRTDEPRGERAIQSRWESLGGTSGVLGSPRGEVHGVAGGFARDFERGVIFWSRATGAHVVLGAILARYRRLGGAGSGLGLPVGEERDAAVSGSRVSVFQHGVVFWSRATGAHVVLGAILARYRRLGGAGSALGLPTTDEYPVREGAKQRFQSGSLLWDRSERRTYSPRQNKIHRAVEIAKNQKGDPYRYGATGPHRFDCSGLIYYSFRKAGLRMPRTTGAQARHGRRIARGDMRKGDLMVFHSGGDVYHDGIFVGWNSDHERLVLHAPYSGQVVRTVPVWTQQWYPVTVR